MTSIYRDLSAERKQLQEEGKLPDWVITNSWQILKEKYVSERYPNLHTVYRRIANHAATYTDDPVMWRDKFFELLWKGWLIPSTPVCANMGTGFGAPVSCSGSYVGDTVFDFYEKQKEAALLSKEGYGTSSYLGDIRARGSDITGVAGSASGVLPVFKGFVRVAQDISQGSQRRGAWAGYIEATHDDFDEIVIHVTKNPEDANLGWIITDEFVEALESGDEEANRRFTEIMKLRMFGRGYCFFVDKVNRANPTMYKERDLKVKASNLCTEITLFSGIDATTGQDYTYSCVLSSMNATKYDEWKDTDAIFIATVFLDCVNEDQIRITEKIPGLERIARFARDSRALGLGLLGFHTYLQDHNIPFESFDAHLFNQSLFKDMQTKTIEASKWMAETWGEPRWCEGTGLRNTHLMAIAPNLSSALIAGGASQGIEPIYKNVFVQNSAGGKMKRSSPALMKIIKREGLDEKETLDDIVAHKGSVQHVTWLTDHEKEVFKTAFEIDQKTILRLAAARQPFIDQAQSINLFFDSDTSEEYISEIHQEAFLNENIKSLYYIRTENGVKSNTTGECVACHG
jgi:ribonucleoside-diphosphate reductase alpha chain